MTNVRGGASPPRAACNANTNAAGTAAASKPQVQATFPARGPMAGEAAAALSPSPPSAEGASVTSPEGRAAGGTPPSPPNAPACAVVSPYLLSEEQMRERQVPEGLFALYSHFYYQSCFGIRTWYPSLRASTMETEFLQLSDQEIDAMYDRCCASHAVQENLLVDDGAALTAELRSAWVGLKKRIESAVAKFPEGVFVRLDTRSTKDAPTNMINATRVRKQILSAVEKMQHASGSIVLDPKQALEAFMESSASAMRASNVDEVLQLLRYSHQVREDLATLRRLRGLGIPCILALRRWDQEMATHSEWEFRAFVHDNAVTGISQLNHTVMNRELLRQRQGMRQMVESFLSTTVVPVLPHKTFIVDLFFSPTTKKLQVVGLNPFEATTCAGLFDWRKDASVLLQGPCQFRIVEATPAMFDRKGRSEDVPMEVIPPKWARVLQSELGCLRFDEHFVHPSLDASGRPMRTQSWNAERTHTTALPAASSGHHHGNHHDIGPSASAMNVRQGVEAREVVHRTTDRLHERERGRNLTTRVVPSTGGQHAVQSASMPAVQQHGSNSHRGHNRTAQNVRTGPEQAGNEHHPQREHKKTGCIVM